MSPKPVVRRHAILKHPYRRTVRATPGFHNLDGKAQWDALRSQVIADAGAAGESSLLDVMDRREARRDEVLAALEEGRQASRK